MTDKQHKMVELKSVQIAYGQVYQLFNGFSYVRANEFKGPSAELFYGKDVCDKADFIFDQLKAFVKELYSKAEKLQDEAEKLS